jgi:hypothetical protein
MATTFIANETVQQHGPSLSAAQGRDLWRDGTSPLPVRLGEDRRSF